MTLLEEERACREYLACCWALAAGVAGDGGDHRQGRIFPSLRAYLNWVRAWLITFRGIFCTKEMFLPPGAAAHSQTHQQYNEAAAVE